MDLASIVEDTEQTQSLHRQADGQTDGQKEMDGRHETSLTPFNFVEAVGIKNFVNAF